MKFICLVTFLILGIAQSLHSQEISQSKTIYKNVNDNKTIKVLKNRLLDVTYAFQKNAASFKIKVQGYPSHNNIGSAFDTTSVDLLKKAQKGNTILIFDIKKEQSNKILPPVHISVQ